MKLLRKIASLKVTLVLLLLSMILVFAGTIAQKYAPTVEVQRRYFDSLLLFVKVGGLNIPVFLGGFTLSVLLVINLLASLATDLWRKRSRWGLFIIHVGLVMLIGAMSITPRVTEESMLFFDEGETKNYSIKQNKSELVFIHDVDEKNEEVFSVPESFLVEGRIIDHEELPFKIKVRKLDKNQVLRLRTPDNTSKAPDTQGAGQMLEVRPRQEDDPEQVGAKALTFELIADGESLGAWIVSDGNLFDGQRFLALRPQTVMHDGVEYRFELRPERIYTKYALRLNDFIHERYPGTDIPKHFASEVTIFEPGQSPHNTKIYMNHPLRFGGKTYYQQSYANNDRTSILLVVENPSWQIPYIACILIFLGMAVQFITTLVRFLTRDKAVREKKERQKLKKGEQLIAWGALLFGILAVAGFIRPPSKSDGFDIPSFGELPALKDGRIKPLDTIARNALLLIHGKQRFKGKDKQKMSASEWLLEVVADAKIADSRAIFRIDNPNILGAFEIEQRGRYYSFDQLEPRLEAFEKQLMELQKTENKEKDPDQRSFEEAGLAVYEKVRIYIALKNTFAPAIEPEYLNDLLRVEEGVREINRIRQSGEQIPEDADHKLLNSMNNLRVWNQQLSGFPHFNPIPNPNPRDDEAPWIDPIQAVAQGMSQGELPHSLELYARLLLARRQGDADAFNKHLAALHKLMPDDVNSKTSAEFTYNSVQPFLLAMAMYVFVFILVAVSWMNWRRALTAAAFRVLVFGFVLHTIGIIWRSWLHGYLPVTNLYGTAIIVGWGAILFGIVIERLYRIGIGYIAASIVGFLTLIIAQHLASGGETMGMLRAVLNSNIWLTSHVITIIIGYSTAFLAGAIAICYVFRRLVTGYTEDEDARILVRMSYGILCFCLLFSFIGTVLGGMWADQSWGRFWGWDPKENGALLVVIWTAIILHARLTNLIRYRGVMVLAVIGNMITGFSWFGVNLLGVGLHSYGFMKKGAIWFYLFLIVHVVIVILGLIPRHPSETPPPPETSPDHSA